MMKRMRNWGVRARVTFVALMPTIVLATLMTATHVSLRLADLDEALLARAQAHARQLAAGSEYAVFSGDLQSLQQLGNALLTADDVLGVAILAADGRLLATAGKPATEWPLAPAAPAPLIHHNGAGRWLRIVEPIASSALPATGGITSLELEPGNASSWQPPPMGTVVVDLSLERLQKRQIELLWIGAGWLLVVALGSLLLVRSMSRSVTGPIRSVAETVQRIGQGRLHERVPVQGGGSLRRLAEGVNEMAERLANVHASMSQRIDDATAQLRARKEEAERANLAKSRFLAAASHDLRQPLHALGLFLSELQQQGLDQRSRRITERISASAEAMESLLDSLLDISRLDAGVLNPAPTHFDLHACLERIAHGYSAAAQARGLRLRLHCPPCRAHTDPHLLERIVSNLVSNAIRYTEQGSVLIACRRRGTRLRIEIRDSGRGIAADEQHIIFQEFVQLDNPERARDKGLGLGLAIVRRLTDLLGLVVELRSAPGRGSVFAIEVPAGTAAEATRAHDDARALGRLDGLVVLLVSEDVPAERTLTDLLTHWGCDMITARRADDAHALINDGVGPNLLLVDLDCTANGLQLVSDIRTRPSLEALPAVLLGTAAPAETLARIQAEGAQFLHKPVRPARLRALMNRLLSTAEPPGQTPPHTDPAPPA